MAGYSKRPLSEKLGIKENDTILVLNEPEGYFSSLSPLPKGVRITTQPGGAWYFIHFFTKQKNELEKMFPFLVKSLKHNGMLWISWPKGSSKIKTDLHENIIRDIGLAHGLVDVKVAAIDEIWSGLKFVYRLKDRP